MNDSHNPESQPDDPKDPVLLPATRTEENQRVDDGQAQHAIVQRIPEFPFEAKVERYLKLGTLVTLVAGLLGIASNGVFNFFDNPRFQLFPFSLCLILVVLLLGHKWVRNHRNRWGYAPATLIATVIVILTLKLVNDRQIKNDATAADQSRAQNVITNIPQEFRETRSNIAKIPTKEEVKLAAKEGYEEARRAEMQLIEQAKGLEFTNEFPLGYVLVTLTESQNPVTLKNPSGGLRVLNWDKASYVSTEKMVKIKVPDIETSALSLVVDPSVEMPRKPGMTVGLLLSTSKSNGAYNLRMGDTFTVSSNAEPSQMFLFELDAPPHTHVFVTRIVKSQTEGSVVLLALKELPKGWKRFQ